MSFEPKSADVAPQDLSEPASKTQTEALDPQHIEQLLSVMTPEIYQRLVTAVELGKWPDGVALSAEQKAHSLQMVLLWQSRHNHDPEHMTVGTDGTIIMKSKQQLKSIFQQSLLATLKPLDNDSSAQH